MAITLQEQMTPLLQRIAGALVEATPEWWTEAAMRVEVKHHGDNVTGMPHSIWSEQHPRDMVVPTNDIYEVTRALQQLCEQAGKPWLALVFRIEQVGDGWRFTTEFEYPAEPLYGF